MVPRVGRSDLAWPWPRSRERRIRADHGMISRGSTGVVSNVGRGLVTAHGDQEANPGWGHSTEETERKVVLSRVKTNKQRGIVQITKHIPSVRAVLHLSYPLIATLPPKLIAARHASRSPEERAFALTRLRRRREGRKG